MSESHGSSGSMPQHYRRLAYAFAGVFFVVLMAAGLVLKLAADVDIPWLWIIATPVFITGLLVLFLWVRLSND